MARDLKKPVLGQIFEGKNVSILTYGGQHSDKSNIFLGGKSLKCGILSFLLEKILKKISEYKSIYS